MHSQENSPGAVEERPFLIQFLQKERGLGKDRKFLTKRHRGATSLLMNQGSPLNQEEVSLHTIHQTW